MRNIKLLFLNIFIVNFLGFIFSLISNPSKNFQNIIKPDFVPSPIVFIIVWIIIYSLLGVSFYLVEKNKRNVVLFLLNLIFNYLWVILFFNFKLYLLSFVWLLTLIGITIIMIYYFYKSDKLAGIINIPYLFWLVFASILNLSIFYLN